jgi:hypothetical protein
MALSPSERAELDRLGVANVQLRLAYSGPGAGAMVPALGRGYGMDRGDVEDWLAERTRETEKMQSDTLWWAKAAAWIGAIGSAVGVVVAIIIAALGR